MKALLIRLVEILNGLGFALIVGSVVYFIIGNVAALAHGTMLDWTFCGTAHRLLGVEWCGVTGDTNDPSVNHFVHHLINTTLPWFMLFWGFILVGISVPLLKLLGYTYARGR
jgi:hypothetical protein